MKTTGHIFSVLLLVVILHLRAFAEEPKMICTKAGCVKSVVDEWGISRDLWNTIGKVKEEESVGTSPVVPVTPSLEELAAEKEQRRLQREQKEKLLKQQQCEEEDVWDPNTCGFYKKAKCINIVPDDPPKEGPHTDPSPGGGGHSTTLIEGPKRFIPCGKDEHTNRLTAAGLMHPNNYYEVWISEENGKFVPGRPAETGSRCLAVLSGPDGKVLGRVIASAKKLDGEIIRSRFRATQLPPIYDSHHNQFPPGTSFDTYLLGGNVPTFVFSSCRHQDVNQPNQVYIQEKPGSDDVRVKPFRLVPTGNPGQYALKPSPLGEVLTQLRNLSEGGVTTPVLEVQDPATVPEAMIVRNQ